MNTTKRYEHKYIISYMDYIKLIEPLKQVLQLDNNAIEGNYKVNSIYLDDIYNSAAQDKAFGNMLHSKYRLRFYNDEQVLKLELKQKQGDETTKYATVLTKELSDAILSQNIDVLYNSIDEPLIRRFILDYNRKLLTPKLVIKYIREAYTDGTDNFRLTFDHELENTYHDDGNIGAYMKVMDDASMILEVKYTHYIPKPVQAILNTIKLNKISYSKYFMGFQQQTL